MMSILKRKYFPPVESDTQSVTVDQHMKDLNLQGEIQELVRSCLRATGRSANKTTVKTYVDNPNWKNKEQKRVSPIKKKKQSALKPRLTNNENAVSPIKMRMLGADTPRESPTKLSAL